MSTTECCWRYYKTLFYFISLFTLLFPHICCSFKNESFFFCHCGEMDFHTFVHLETIVFSWVNQSSLRTSPLRSKLSSSPCPRWQSGEMERFVFGKTSSRLEVNISWLIVSRVHLVFLWLKQSNLSLPSVVPHRGYWDSWFWCRVQTPPVRCARLPSPN